MLKIPLPLPTLNEVIADAKKHWSAYANAKTIHTRRVAAWARVQGARPITRSVCFTFAWYPKDRRADLDNLAAGGAKVVLDGLVQARVLPDDGQRYVRRLDHLLMNPDPENPRVEVSWCEVHGE